MNLIDEYIETHKHPLNRLTHYFGIPTILISLVLVFFHPRLAIALFIAGWILQISGHIIEGNRPAFLKSPIHLLVGPYWWLRKIVTLKR